MRELYFQPLGDPVRAVTSAATCWASELVEVGRLEATSIVAGSIEDRRGRKVGGWSSCQTRTLGRFLGRMSEVESAGFLSCQLTHGHPCSQQILSSGFSLLSSLHPPSFFFLIFVLLLFFETRPQVAQAGLKLAT